MGSRTVPIVNRRRAVAESWIARQEVQAVPIAESATVMPMAVESGEGNHDWDSSVGSLSLQNRIQAMDVRDQQQRTGEFSRAVIENEDGEDEDMILG